MKSLIIGAHGMIGLALSKEIPSATKIVHGDPNPRSFELYADITNYQMLFDIFSSLRPETVYLCAGVSNVDACEDHGTDRTNISGHINVLRLCEQFGSRLVFFSSSYVFDGVSKTWYPETAATRPINNYGVQKATLESVISQVVGPHLVIRTIGVFGPELLRKNFVHRISDAVATGRKVHVPDDQMMNPISSWDLAKTVVAYARDPSRVGVYHVAGQECVTKYDWAVHIADYFGASKLVIPTASSHMKQVARRPKMGCLKCDNRATSLRHATHRLLDSEVGA